jgi:hypothetical protein
MKRQISVLIFCLIVISTSGVFAQIKPYLAVVNTGKEVFKGILYAVTPDSIGVKQNSELIFFKSCDIKSIKVKSVKRSSKYMKYLNSNAYNERNYDKVSNKMVPVRKWGEENPTIEEELSCRIITSFYNAAISGVASSVNFLNGSLAIVNVDYNDKKYKEQVAALTFHSLLYQNNPENSLEAESVKPLLASKEQN